jgi:hypothetical protein
MNELNEVISYPYAGTPVTTVFQQPVTFVFLMEMADFGGLYALLYRRLLIFGSTAHVGIALKTEKSYQSR